MHVDPGYTPGKNSECNNIICCREDSGDPVDPENAAGLWGNFNCDVPWRTVRSMLEFVSSDIQPDLVFWLGDSVAHNFDSLNKDDVVGILQNATSMMTEFFDPAQVYPSIGNHDTYPQDIMAFAEPRQNEAMNEW